jgi:hypothetical protein
MAPPRTHHSGSARYTCAAVQQRCRRVPSAANGFIRMQQASSCCRQVPSASAGLPVSQIPKHKTVMVTGRCKRHAREVCSRCSQALGWKQLPRGALVHGHARVARVIIEDAPKLAVIVNVTGNCQEQAGCSRAWKPCLRERAQQCALARSCLQQSPVKLGHSK